MNRKAGALVDVPTQEASAPSRSTGGTWRDIDWADHRRSVSVGDEQIGYVELGTIGPPVLFVHGLGGNWAVWLETLPAVARTHRTFAVDLPGFGRSPLPVAGVSIRNYARTLQRLCAELGLDEVVLVGSSMGGWVGAELALLDPALVGGLVLVSAAGIVPTPAERRKSIALMQGAALMAPLLPRLRRAIAYSPRVRNLALRYTMADPASLAADLVFAATPAVPDPGFRPAFAACRRSWSTAWCDRLVEIDCPALVVWGDRDSLLPLRHAHEWARRLQHSNLEVLPGVGHLAMLEAPEAFNAALRRFLEAPTEPGGPRRG